MKQEFNKSKRPDCGSPDHRFHRRLFLQGGVAASAMSFNGLFSIPAFAEEAKRKQRELDDARRELDLTVEKRVQEGLTATRDQARKEA